VPGPKLFVWKAELQKKGLEKSVLGSSDGTLGFCNSVISTVDEKKRQQSCLLRWGDYRSKCYKLENYPGFSSPGVGVGFNNKNFFLTIFKDTYRMIRHMIKFRAINWHEMQEVVEFCRSNTAGGLTVSCKNYIKSVKDKFNLNVSSVFGKNGVNHCKLRLSLSLLTNLQRFINLVSNSMECKALSVC
jgi:hypothetical protein